jgi:hypothetical protein
MPVPGLVPGIVAGILSEYMERAPRHTSTFKSWSISQGNEFRLTPRYAAACSYLFTIASLFRGGKLGPQGCTRAESVPVEAQLRIVNLDSLP